MLFKLCFGFLRFSKVSFLGNHQFFILCEIMKFFFIKTHKTTWPLGRGGNFFPLLRGDFGCSVITKLTGIAFRSVRVAQLLVLLHNFARIWGSPNSPEIGVRFMCFMISSKLLYQIVRALLRFAHPNFSLLSVFIGFSSCPNQKDINV